MAASTRVAEGAPRVLIIGAGQAGSEAAFALRQLGHQGSLCLIGEEPWLPYRRPPLSKTFLVDQATPESLAFKPAVAYEQAGIERVAGVAVLGIDRAAAEVVLADQRRLPYEHLILALGGRARRLPLAGCEAENVFTLRGIDDGLALRREFIAGRRLVVVGGGYIGLEIAALARQAGLDVVILEATPRLLARVASPVLSQFCAQVHAAAGVEIHLDSELSSLCADGDRVHAVRTLRSEFAADLVLLGVGLQPNTALAAAAGLQVASGIVTDRLHRSSEGAIFAIGDCAEFEHDWLGQRVRLESVPNALEQGRRVAKVVLGTEPGPMAAPWFWSDQYDLKLQTVGIVSDIDHSVLRGDPASRSFVAFHFRRGQLVAAEAVNRMAEFAKAKALVAARATIDPCALADPNRPLP